MRRVIGVTVLLAIGAWHQAAPSNREVVAAQPVARPIAPLPRHVLPPLGRPSAAGTALLDLGYVEVPFSRVPNPDGSGSGILIVQARLDDRPVRLMLDTGAMHSVMDRDWVKSAGLKTEAYGAKAGGLGAAEVAVRRMEKVDISLGSLSAPAVPLVLDLSHVNAGLSSSGLPVIDGILGDSMFQHFAAVIDYPGTRLYLLPRNLQMPTELAGTWQGVSEERDGKLVEPPSTWRAEFSNGQVRLTQDGVTIGYRPVFGAAGTKTVTLESVINRKPVSHPGLYAIENGRLKLCLRMTTGGAPNAPKSLATKAGDDCVLIELERIPSDP